MKKTENSEYQKKLFELRDAEYAAFQAKLTPTVPAELFIGVRVPQVRKLAKELMQEARASARAAKAMDDFLRQLPHKYYDENMLHGLLISEVKDYTQCVELADAFLPFVDNWAVCDIMSPKVFKKNKPQLVEKIRQWIASDEEYTCRFGMEMLMTHFLDEDFKPEYLKWVAKVRSEKYYINMMIAWYFATALAKQEKSTLPFIEKRSLSPWCHNKAIQKARESYRISDQLKSYLQTLKVAQA